MDFSVSNLFAGLVFGAFGISIFRLGKKRAHPAAIVTGLALMIFPYFIENTILMWVIGSALLFFGWTQIK
jgi:hypothetical protein